MQGFIPKLLLLPVPIQAWEAENTRKKGEINASLKAFKQFGFGLTEEMVKASKCGFHWQIKGFFPPYFPKEARPVNQDVYASCTAFWFMVTSEDVEHS